MIQRYAYRGTHWIDLERPTIDEVQRVVDEMALGAAMYEELATPTRKPRVDSFPSFVYMVLHFPASRDTRGKSPVHEVDFVITKDTVLTVHYDTVPALIDFASTIETVLLLKRADIAIHSGHILFELAGRLYQGVEDELNAIEENVEGLERTIFAGRERELVEPLSILTRELLNHKRTIQTHEEVLRGFEGAARALFGDQFVGYAAAVSALHFRSLDRARALLETLSELRDTNNAFVSTRQNEITKNLTIVASVMLPLSLIASLFGMNIGPPLPGSSYDFFIVIGFMALCAAVTVLYFKVKKWF